jgi:hypothetical protein
MYKDFINETAEMFKPKSTDPHVIELPRVKETADKPRGPCEAGPFLHKK